MEEIKIRNNFCGGSLGKFGMVFGLGTTTMKTIDLGFEFLLIFK